MPEAIKTGTDGADYEQCLVDLKDKGDARFGICMKSYEQHHAKNDKGEWVRKDGHSKNDKGEWTVKSNNHSEFAGFDDFIPIFQGGKQTDSQGIEHDGDELIDQAVTKFDPSYHEAPVVVGHPKDNSPAFGWVESIKKVAQQLKDGTTVNVLMAKFKNIVPEFASAVQQGLYKKRSASFYPDGRLRHVGFLGGMPPAVKGLADLKFSEDDKAIEFEEPIQFMAGGWGLGRVAEIFRGLRDYFIEKFGLEEANKVFPSYQIDNIKEDADQLSLAELPQTAVTPLFSEKEGKDMPKTFTEEELQAQLKVERDRITAEFAEQQKAAQEATEAAKKADSQRQADIEAAKAAVKADMEAKFAEREAKMKADAHKKEVSEFVQSSIQTGKILPAWAKMGLAQFMEALPSETPIEFGEEGVKISKTPYEFFKAFLAEIPKTVNFGEFAGRDKNVGGQGNAGARLNDLTAAKMKENSKLGYVMAFAEVQREHPDLVREYDQEIHRGIN